MGNGPADVPGNKVLQTIAGRRSVRRYTREPVPHELVHAVLEAANSAPSAHNRQSWRFVVVQGEARERLAALVAEASAGLPRAVRVLLRMGSQVIRSAPVVVAVFSTGELTREMEGEAEGEHTVHDFFKLMEVQSTSAAVENMMLAAASLGLGSVWLGVVCLIRERIAALLAQEGDLQAVVPLGWPASDPGRPPRKKPVSEVTVF